MTTVLFSGPLQSITIEEAMPVLVEVQRHLVALPDKIDRLDAGLDRLSTLLERLLAGLDGLNGSIDTLQGAVEPMGRLAKRMPGQKKD